MKQLLRVTICILLIAALLCACGGNFEPEAGPVAREMMTALENGDTEAAVKLMHPDAKKQIKDLDKSVQTMIEFVDGRYATELRQETINIRNQVGTNAGKHETGTFRAVLDDGTVLKIESTYLKNSAGAGFVSFYLSMGT